MPIRDSRHPLLIPEPGQTHQADDPDRVPRVRGKLSAILAEIEGAESMPWSDQDRAFYRTVVPQMTNWLPPGEAAEITQRFFAALDRLGRMAA